MNYCFIHSFSAVPVNRLNIRPLTNINTPSFYDRNKEQSITILLPISNLITYTSLLIIILLRESLVFSYFGFNTHCAELRSRT
jgi:hypothetical protein